MKRGRVEHEDVKRVETPLPKEMPVKAFDDEVDAKYLARSTDPTLGTRSSIVTSALAERVQIRPDRLIPLF